MSVHTGIWHFCLHLDATKGHLLELVSISNQDTLNFTFQTQHAVIGIGRLRRHKATAQGRAPISSHKQHDMFKVHVKDVTSVCNVCVYWRNVIITILILAVTQNSQFSTAFAARKSKLNCALLLKKKRRLRISVMIFCFK